jgi:glycine hydroxymethyltransferase
MIADLLDNPNDPANIAKVKAQVSELTKRFPVYG